MLKWNNKINAGALQYVLVVAIIILILLFAFVQLIDLQQKTNTKSNLYQKATLNSNNGFKYLASHEIENKGEVKLNFSENTNEEVSLKKKYWGIFDLVRVFSKVNKEEVEKTALLGNKIKNKKAIYLTDNNTPLVLVGHSKIKGKVYLPSRGVKTGNIAGNSFYGRTLINGAIKTSTSRLPKNNRIKTIANRFNSLFNTEGNFELQEEMKMVRSFKETPLHYKAYGDIKLEYISLKGNIIISSNTKIVVYKDAVLDDVILIAPEIEIKKGFKGNFQAYASKKINVERDVNLLYPSSLVVNSTKEKIEDDIGIFIDKNSTVRGTLVFLKKKSEVLNYFPQIKLEANTKIIGEVFCEGNTELLGNVIGEIYTDNFIAVQSGTKYMSHIYNGNIDANSLQDEYVGLGITSKEKSVAKWLY